MNVKMKKTMQVGLQAIILASALQVNATGIAPSDTPSGSTISNANCSFVSTTSPFSITLSRNVGLAYNCDNTTVAVQAGNTKGKSVYGGSSNGGSVKVCTGATLSTTNGFASDTPALTGDGCS